MNTTDHAPLIAIAMLAARADGSVDSAEQRVVDGVVAHIGNPDVAGLAQQIAAGQLRVADLVSRLSDYEARRAAYEGALAVINADGSANESEQYYAQGRRLSAADLRELFVRFQSEAKTIYPRVQEQIHRQASALNVQSLLHRLSNS